MAPIHLGWGILSLRAGQICLPPNYPGSGRKDFTVTFTGISGDYNFIGNFMPDPGIQVSSEYNIQSSNPGMCGAYCFIS